MRRQGWRSRLGWLASVGLVTLVAAGSAWATPVAYSLTFTCTGPACSVAAPSLTLSVDGSKVTFSGSAFGQSLTGGTLLLLTPGNPASVTGVVDSVGLSAVLALTGIGSILPIALTAGTPPPGGWLAHYQGVTVGGRFSVAPAAIPEPSAALAFAAGAVVIARRLRRN